MIPTGMKPYDLYKDGSWDKDPTGAQIESDTTFTYTFAADPHACKAPISLLDDELDFNTTGPGVFRLVAPNGADSDYRIYYKLEATTDLYQTGLGGFVPMAPEFTSELTIPVGETCVSFVGLSGLDTVSFQKVSKVTTVFLERRNPTFTLAVNDPAYGTVTSDVDSLLNDKGSAIFELGKEIEVSASANPGYRFVEWVVDWGEDDSSASRDESFTFTLTGSAVLTAVFEPKPVYYKLTYKCTPEKGGTFSSDSESEVLAGITATFSITANPGYKLVQLLVNGTSVRVVSFGGVSGGVTIYKASYTPTSDTEVEAVFEKREGLSVVTLHVFPETGGELYLKQGTNIYKNDHAFDTGSFLNFTAAPYAGYSVEKVLVNDTEYKGFSNTNFGSTFTLNEDTDITAYFVINEFHTSTVQWLNGDGSVLHKEFYNTLSEAPPLWLSNWGTPVKAEDEAYTYTFHHWAELSTENYVTTYEPIFTAVPKNKQATRIVDQDGNEITEIVMSRDTPLLYAFSVVSGNNDFPLNLVELQDGVISVTENGAASGELNFDSSKSTTRMEWAFLGYAEKLGKHTLTVSYAGNDIYDPCSTQFTLRIVDTLHVAAFSPATAYANKRYKVTGQIYDFADRCASGLPVSVYTPAGYQFDDITDVLGKFSFYIDQDIPAEAGNEITLIIFVGEGDGNVEMKETRNILFTESKLVSQIRIDGFETPVEGKQADAYLNLTVPENSHYSIKFKGWFCENLNTWLMDREKFVLNREYSCGVDIVLESGYEFDDTVEFFINGSKDNVGDASINRGNGTARVFAHPVKPLKEGVRLVLRSDPLNIGYLSGAGYYRENSEVTAVASLTDGNYRFVGWYDEINEKYVSDNARYTFIISDKDTALTAKYKLATSITMRDIEYDVLDVNGFNNVRYLLEPRDISMQSHYQKVTLTLNGKEIGTRWTSDAGFRFLGSELELGTNTLTLSYAGDNTYAPCSTTFTVEIVHKKKLHVEDFAPTLIEAGKPYTITGRIVDEDNKAYVGNLFVDVSRNEDFNGLYTYTVKTNENGEFSATVNEATWIPSAAGVVMYIRANVLETDDYALLLQSQPVDSYSHSWDFCRFGSSVVPGKNPGESGYFNFYVNYKCTCDHPGEYEEHDGAHWTRFETTQEAEITYTPPTCETDGECVYKFVFHGLDGVDDERWISKAFPATGHIWVIVGEPVYTGDNEACSVGLCCAICESAIVVSSVGRERNVFESATCEKGGRDKINFLFPDEYKWVEDYTYLLVNTDPLGHKWTPSQFIYYNFEEGDGGKMACKVILHCENDPSHTETVLSTASVGWISAYADCDTEGEETIDYSFPAEFSWLTPYAQKKFPIAAEGHTWVVDSYTWTEVGSSWQCTATAICKTNIGHIETETVTATAEITRQPTEELEGEITYTAVFSKNTLFDEQTRKDPIAKLKRFNILYAYDDSEAPAGFDWALYQNTWTGEDHSALENERAELPQVPASKEQYNGKRKGYWTFAWSAKRDDNGESVEVVNAVIAPMPYSDITVTGKWTFHPNGGTEPTITTDSPLASATAGEEYRAALEANGDDTILWSFVGDLPAWLSLSGSSITGKPDAAGTITFKVRAENNAGYDEKEFTLTVEEQIHKLTVSSGGNGTVACESATGIENEQVEISADPATGYVFDKWVLKDGSAGTISDVTVNPATFTFGAGDAEVVAQFKLETYTLTGVVNLIDGGKIDFSESSARMGDPMRVSVTVNEGYVFDSLSLTGKEGSVDIIPQDTGDWTFIMPASNVTATAKFKRITTIKFVELGDNPCDAGDSYVLYFQVSPTDNESIRDLITVTVDGKTDDSFEYWPSNGSYLLRLNPSPGSLTVGDHTIVVSFAGDADKTPCNASFLLTITTKITQIQLNCDNAKMKYMEGEELDVNGLTLEVSMSDGSKETVTVTKNMVSGFDNSKLGKQALTVEYKGFNAVYEIEVQAIYTVTFNANGGSVTITSAVTGLDGKLTDPLPIPTRTKYTFDGWYTAATGGTKVDLTKVYTKNTRLYAHWIYNGGSSSGSGGSGSIITQYTLTYNTNGGSALASVKHARGTTVSLAATPTREGCSFTGWYADAALTNKITSIKMDGNKTVYAGWKENEDPGTGAHACPSAHLKDVDINAWYHEYVDYVVENGLMYGIADDRFGADVTTSRAMIVTILYRLENRPAVSGVSPFDDVAEDLWYTDAVKWAEANKIVEGYGNGKFGPNDLITREQFAAIMYRYSRFKGYNTDRSADLSGYTDADQISDWALEAMKWAVAEGLITGRTTTTLVARGIATRAEAAAILMRYIENKK